MSRLEFACRLDYPSGVTVDTNFATESLVTGLLGPSGSGKTSVLSMIAGLRQPTAGRIVLDGRVLFDGRANVNLAPEARQIGYVPQEGLLFPHLTVRRNLLYGARRRSSERESTAWEIVVRELEIGELLDRLPQTLSGGQQRRVAIGRAILSRPRLLLLDEPLNSLDEDRGKQVLALLTRAMTDSPLPVIYVTHNPQELAGFGASMVTLINKRGQNY